MSFPLSGPNFGSYDASDVLWLLKDLSDADLEAPTEEREEAIQSGKGHYSESLPIEYQPSKEYYQLYHDVLEQTALKVAEQVAVVSEKIMKVRNGNPVLVSLARAGTPIGILIKRYLEKMYGCDFPHYAVSIIRGRGIDVEAMNYLRDNHNPEDVIFIDGWTGKGAITKELAAAIEGYNAEFGTNFSHAIAVLADPGHAVSIYGTREDYLIPSACLNSTVSGLISRTVFNDEYIKPGDFHGAKFYREFISNDVSNDFIDKISSLFSAEKYIVSDEDIVYMGEEPSFEGWATVEDISVDYGINSVNLVKPGVGETTRVILRRVPEMVLINPKRKDNLVHILMLCAERNVPVVEVEDLVFSCVGLISPQKGTGFDGKKAS